MYILKNLWRGENEALEGGGFLYYYYIAIKIVESIHYLIILIFFSQKKILCFLYIVKIKLSCYSSWNFKKVVL